MLHFPSPQLVSINRLYCTQANRLKFGSVTLSPAGFPPSTPWFVSSNHVFLSLLPPHFNYPSSPRLACWLPQLPATPHHHEHCGVCSLVSLQGDTWQHTPWSVSQRQSQLHPSFQWYLSSPSRKQMKSYPLGNWRRA